MYPFSKLWRVQPEEEGRKFLRNLVTYLPEYTVSKYASQPSKNLRNISVYIRKE
jgi:hypothetical protein